ncbi:hypothetical protein KL86PLE_20128 [uncultured Pleomorphomonas sp.]|uniref:Uncharacterized protein n=1 Tax=uncultured Pleomorphomonas sp. TaxID=442121 RepID=A0A212LD83_9HYPH|nr:hypothetical protein KL86PLE_20128 [uncultured Pleomorphomonas sp.]
MQRFCKPKVGGSIPSSGTMFLLRQAQGFIPIHCVARREFLHF